jgi:RHS repeat-associated protein
LLYQVTETATATNTRTYHYDYRDSTITVSADSGQVTDRVEYSAYGLPTYRVGTTDTPFLFNGRYGVQTDTNGLLYMQARYYNAFLCRFINPDPSGFDGGLNFYSYAAGNPFSLVDPFGLNAQSTGDISFSWDSLKGENSGLFNWAIENAQGMNDMVGDPLTRGINNVLLGDISDIGNSAMTALPGDINSPDAQTTSADVKTAATVGSMFIAPEEGASEGGTVRVGRWMSQEEADAMAVSGTVQAPLSGAGATHVTVPPNPTAFTPQPSSGSVFIEFDVPSSQLRVNDPGQGWGRVFGPNSLEARYAASKGLPIPIQMPPATRIQQTASQWPR